MSIREDIQEEERNIARMQLEEIRRELKSRKIKLISIARRFDKSPGWIGEIFRGNYPFAGGYLFPKYISDYLKEIGIDAEMFN